MSDVYFGTDFFADLERMQRQLSGLFDGLPSSLLVDQHRHLSTH